jgi:RNA polymerase sigma factor (sigma-70 family)
MARELGTVLRHLHRLAAAPPAREPTDGDLVHAFASRRDAAAFADLVRRHGPMVLGVCRHVLGHVHDAEDAFQATFLILARKAATVRHREALAAWLHGVAHRTAMNAKRNLARRRAAERQAPVRTVANPAWDAAWQEVEALLHAEIQRLPEKYRTPFILCHLESRSRAEAARELGLKEGTVWSRLAEARRRLRERLASRGITLSAALGAAALAETAQGAGPAPLLSATIRAALAYAAGQPATAASSPGVAALVHGVTRTMLITRLLMATALLLGAGAVATSATLLAGLEAPAEMQPPKPPKSPAPRGEQHQADAGPRPRTDTLGDPLPAEAVARLGTVRFRHGQHISFVTFALDGTLVSHGSDGFRVWDPATGREIPRFPRRTERKVPSCALAPDGRTLAEISSGDDITFWNLATGRLIRQFGKTENPQLAFSPDAKTIVTFGSMSELELWDVTAGRKMHSWNAHGGWVWSALFTPDGKTLLTTGNDRSIRFWDVATAKPIREIVGQSQAVGNKVALSPDGRLLAGMGVTERDRGGVNVWEPDNLVWIWDVASGKEVRQLTIPAAEVVPGVPRGIVAVTFTRDGKGLLTSGPDERLRIWDPATGREVRRIPVGPGNPWLLAFSPDGKTLAVAGGQALRLIDLETGRDSVRVPGHRQGVAWTAFSSDGRVLATAAATEAIIRVWDPATGRERFQLNGHTGSITSLRMASDRRTLWSTGSDPTLRAWDLETGKELRRMSVSPPGEAGPILLALSPDGKLAAVAGQDPAIILIDMATGKELRRLTDHPAYVAGAAFTPDGRTLVVWAWDHAAHLWDVATGRNLHQFSFPQYPMPGGQAPALFAGNGGGAWSPAFFACLSPDGRLIAYGSQERFLVVQVLGTGRELFHLAGLPDGVSALAISPDSKTLAWGGWRDPTIHLVEIATGQDRHRLVGHQGRVLSLTFAADGRRLVSGDEDTTALVWDLAGSLEASRKPLLPKELDAGWTDLASDDAARAYQALRRLIADPVQAVPHLAKHVQPAVVPDEKRLARLIANLDSDRFEIRNDAVKALQQLGEAAIPACRQALAGRPSAEVRGRLEALIARQSSGGQVPGPERLRTLRALEVLELAGTPKAVRVLEELAKGGEGFQLTSEANASLSRLAARSRTAR